MAGKTKYAAGGEIRTGKVPNPSTLGIFVNPSRKKNEWRGDSPGHQISRYHQWDTEKAAALKEAKANRKKRRYSKLTPSEIDDALKKYRKGKKSKSRKSSSKKRKSNPKKERGTMAKRRRKRRKRRVKRTYNKRRVKRSYGKRRMKRRRRRNPSRKMKRYRRRRRNNPMSSELAAMLKPVAAGAIGFAAPGLLDILTRNWFSTKIKETIFKTGENRQQKAQAALSFGTFLVGMYATNKFETGKKYRQEILMGLGIRTARDLMDAFLGKEKDSLSGNIRTAFGLTLPAGAVSGFYMDTPVLSGERSFGDMSGSEMGAYYLDEPSLSGDRSYGDMDGDMGAWSDTEMENPFDDPFGE